MLADAKGTDDLAFLLRCPATGFGAPEESVDLREETLGGLDPGQMPDPLKLQKLSVWQ
jgi:hypothetical protein